MPVPTDERDDGRSRIMARAASIRWLTDGDGFSAAFARQQIADCHPGTAIPLDHNVAGFYFRLHCLTTSMCRVVGIANGSTELGRVDQTVVAPCAAAFRNCAINSYLK